MLRPFDYHRPRTLDEACALGATLADAAYLAGGTDLLVKIRDGKQRARNVIDLKRVAGLGRVRRDGDHLVIGALCTITDLLHAEEVHAEPGLAVLRDAGVVFGCEEIRHRATVCGNVAHASPGAEYGSPMFVLEADCVLHGPAGERTIPVADFYRGPGRSALGPGEILKALRVPIAPRSARSAYLRRSRVRGMDLAGLNLALLVLDATEPARRRVRLAMGAVAGTPIRAPEVEALLSGAPITRDRLEQAKGALSAGISPRPTSLRASPEYKKAMVAHLLEAGLERLLEPFPEEVMAEASP
ncbi:MAG: FAD binding domain-containing protein [Deltaproteobacteria bacterium]|nr:FAD binding domain-containing protein [Deltaproteobacteria bacterium]